MLRRPPDRAALHFYAICLLFFLMYSTSYTGKLNFADWTILWTDHLSILFLPVAFLHFCLSFPERRLSRARAWMIPAAYLPALTLAGAAVAAQVLFASTDNRDALWRITTAIDRWKPLYFGALFAASFAILLDSYRKTRSVTARKQMKWLVWGTGTGVLPFFLFYAIPFALGREPRLAMELAGYIPLALIPLSLAYAVVKHRLMDVELIFRRTLVYILAIAAIVGMCLLVVNLFEVVLAQDHEPHVTIIAILSTLVVTLLFSAVKNRIQDVIDRLFYRERYNSRRVLLRLSQDLNADLDLARMAERLLGGVDSALGVNALALFLPDHEGAFAMFRGVGGARGTADAKLPADGALVQRLAGGEPVQADAITEKFPEAGGARPLVLLPLPGEGRDHRHPRRRAQERVRAAEQRRGRPAAGAGRPGRHRLHERPAVPEPAREGGRAAVPHRLQREHLPEHGLGDPRPRPRERDRALEPGHGGAVRRAAAGRSSAARWTTSSPRRSWTPSGAASCSAGTRRRPASTS